MSKKSRTRKDKLKLIESTLLLTMRMIVTTIRIGDAAEIEMGRQDDRLFLLLGVPAAFRS